MKKLFDTIGPKFANRDMGIPVPQVGSQKRRWSSTGCHGVSGGIDNDGLSNVSFYYNSSDGQRILALDEFSLEIQQENIVV